MHYQAMSFDSKKRRPKVDQHFFKLVIAVLSKMEI